jgi:hypothetical protein
MRCVEWYDKFERDGNFCGLSAGGVSQVKAYNELRKKIGVHIPDAAFVVDHFPEGAARILSSVKDDETRTTGLNYVIECLKRKEKVTAGDLRAAIKMWLQPSSCPVRNKGGNLGHVSKKFTNVNSPTEQKPDPAVPETPVQSLADKLKETPVEQSPEPVAPEQPAAVPETPPAPVEDPKQPVWTQEVCKTGTCPDGQCHLTKGTLGDKCGLSGSFIRDQKFCPYLERKRRAELRAAQGLEAPEKPAVPVSGFSRANGTSSPTLTGLPKKTSTDPQTLTIRFDNDQWDTLKNLQRAGQADGFEEAVKFCVDEIGRAGV